MHSDKNRPIEEAIKSTVMTTAIAPIFNAANAISTREITDNVNSKEAIRRITHYGKEPESILKGWSISMLQQLIKGASRNMIWLNKSTIDEYTGPWSNSVVVGLTLANEIITLPFTVKLTRIYESTSAPKSLHEHFSGLMPTLLKLGLTTGIYLKTKEPIDNCAEAMNINPMSVTGALMTAPLSGVAVSIPTQPLERITRAMQQAKANHLSFFQSGQQLVTNCKALYVSEGIMPMLEFAFRGWKPRLAGNTLFSVALNLMVLMGSESVQETMRPEPKVP